ncbi:methyltransferase [Acrasis kona]|uniref:Methyltransferase n=1 Tax=Acrasis kona TaxID=1008807 RepID=A0AAW2ZDJ6_9EUKA
MQRPKADNFTAISRTYNQVTGGATRDVGKFILSIAPKIDKSSHILDNACGTGIVSEEIRSIHKEAPIQAIDFSSGMIEVVRGLSEENNWESFDAKEMNGQELEFPDETFTHSISNFGIFMFPDSRKGLSEARRTLKTGGWIVVTSWSLVGWYQPLYAAFNRFKPNCNLFIPPKFPLWNTKQVAFNTLSEAGFKNVETLEYNTFAKQKNIETHVTLMTSSLKKQLMKDWPLTDISEFEAILRDEFEKVVEVDEEGNYAIKMNSLVSHGIK